MGWVIFIVCAAAVLNWFGLVWRAKRRAKLARNFVARHNLAIDAASLVVAERLLVAQARGRHVGSVVGLAVMSGLAFLEVLRPDGDVPAPYAMAGILPVLWLIALGGAVGVQLAGRPAPDAPRVARAPLPAFDDYVQPWRRWLGPVLLAVAVPLTVLSTSAGYELALALGLTALSVVASELTCRWILRAPQPAADRRELHLRDTIKGEALAELSTGLVPAFLVGSLLLERSSGLHGSVMIGIVVLVATLVITEHQRRRRLADRLWPEPASA